MSDKGDEERAALARDGIVVDADADGRLTWTLLARRDPLRDAVCGVCGQPGIHTHEIIS